MNRIDGKVMSTDHALETLCLLCCYAPLATTITQIHPETGGGGSNRFHGPYSQYTSELLSCIGVGWVASHEHILLPFSTPQPHALPSANSKTTRVANNKERLAVPHVIVWCRTILGGRVW
jgi:hypothetical protein